MRQFNKTLLALAGVILLGAGSALAQGVLFESGGSFTQVRGEGITENVGQVTLLANNAGTVPINSSITITYSATISAHAGAASISCVLGGAPAACTNMTVTVSGSQFTIAFTAAQAFAVNDSVTISQVRINASAGATQGGQITATPSAVSTLPGTNPITFNPPFANIIVGVVSLPSTLVSNVQAFSPNGGGVVTAPLAVVTCAPPLGAGASFAFRITEAIPNAWTTLAEEQAYTPAEVDPASNGTWISVTLTGIPAGFNVTAIAPTANGANPFPTMVLVAAGSSVPPGGTVPQVAFAPLTVTQTTANTPVVFTYTFTVANQAAIEQAVLNFNLVPTPTATTIAPGGLVGPVTATVAYAPLQPSPAPLVNAGFIPRFAAANTLGTVTLANISDCITRLLFPWMLGGNGGYDTGVAIANTSQDLVAFTGSGNAIAQNGTCQLTGYPTAGGTPIQATLASISAGSVKAFNLSTISGFSGFSGYVLAVCNFLNAHGFVFITNGFGSVAGPNLAEGYLPLIVPFGSRVVPFGEGLGH